MKLSILNPGILSIKWEFKNDQKNKFFEVPADFIPINRDDLMEGAMLIDYVTVGTRTDGSFFLTVKNELHNPIWQLEELILQTHFNYINATAFVDKDNFKGILGLLDQPADPSLFIPDGKYTLWNRKEQHATHPFWMAKSQNSSWFGVFHNNIAAQDWVIKNDPDNGKVSVTTTSAGGVADIFIFVGPKPDNITQLYQTVVGFPALIPDWALGWHQSHLGYQNVDQMNVSVHYYSTSVLPLDAQWVDVDYMDNFTDFTVSPSFGNLSSFVNQTKSGGIYSVVKLNTGIAQKNTSDIYKQAYFNGSLLMDTYGMPLTGAGWAGDVVYLDQFNETTSKLWPKWLEHLTSNKTSNSLNIDFDGIWLDDSEIHSDCNGQCYSDQKPMSDLKL